MKMRFGWCLAMALGGCSATGNFVTKPEVDVAADSAVRALGIVSYGIDGDLVHFFDARGVDVGSLEVRAPSSTTRLLEFSKSDGSVDEIVIYRPVGDRFFAPIRAITTPTTVATDPALAPFFSSHAILFKTVTLPIERQIAANDVANLTTCTNNANTPEPSPAGCARTANPPYCTNVPQMTPYIVYDYTNSYTGQNADFEYDTRHDCSSNIASDCASRYGGTASSWNGHYECDVNDLGDYDGTCLYRATGNNWNASCVDNPGGTSHCPGLYDVVGRLDDCYDPGSCIGYAGTTTTCSTTYH